MPRDRITLVPSEKRVRVMTGDATVADSTGTLLLLETGHRPVYYFPREHVRMDLLTPTAKTSYCPYKGRASYWSLQVGDRTAADAAWAYLDPLPECPRIKGHLCFYPQKVERAEVERMANTA